MQNSIKALEVSIDHNLSDFSVFLWQNKISHQINESAGQQVIWVQTPEDQQKVLNAYEALCSGDLVLRRVENPDHVKNGSLLVGTLLVVKKVPVTILFILLSILGYLLVTYDHTGQWQRWLTFFNSSSSFSVGGIIGSNSANSYSELWRLITPIFLHFHILHVTFNCLWIWELSKRLELGEGSLHVLGVVLLIALGSNMGQDYWQGVQGQYGPFGGMSGVVYGLLGYIWVLGKTRSHPLYQLPSGLMAMMVGWMLFCMSGIIEMFGPANMSIANAAHLCGLIVGLVMGVGNALLIKPAPQNND